MEINQSRLGGLKQLSVGPIRKRKKILSHPTRLQVPNKVNSRSRKVKVAHTAATTMEITQSRLSGPKQLSVGPIHKRKKIISHPTRLYGTNKVHGRRRKGKVEKTAAATEINESRLGGLKQ